MRLKTATSLRTFVGRLVERLSNRPVVTRGGVPASSGRRRYAGSQSSFDDPGQLPEVWYVEACEEWAARSPRRAV